MYIHTLLCECVHTHICNSVQKFLGRYFFRFSICVNRAGRNVGKYRVQWVSSLGLEKILIFIYTFIFLTYTNQIIT